MLSRINRWFAPPPINDPDTSHTVGLLHTSLLVVLAGAVALPILVFIFDSPPGFVISSIFVVTIVIVISLMVALRRGHVQPVAVCLTTTLWLAFTTSMVTYDGIYDSAVTGYFIVIILAALTLGRRGVFVFTGLTIAALGTVYFASRIGAKTVHLQVPSPVINLVLIVISVTAAALLLRVALVRLTEAYTRVRQNELVLEAQTAALRDTNARLEREIASRIEVEQALTEAKQSLEKTVAERTAELRETNAQLQHQLLEREQAEHALRNSEEKYRAVVENANEAIVVAQGGYLKFFNPKLLEWSGGYTETEIKSIPFAEFIHPDDRAMILDFHQQRLQGKEPPQLYCFRIINKTGLLKWAEINVVPITWEDAPATLFFLSDITERKQMELELELSHTELEARVQKRTAELTAVNDQLQHEIAERTRIELAQKESHERLLTILDSIDADIYVSDMETYEILFMNKHMQETFGENLVSKICWQEFRGEDGPCSHCSNPYLLDEHGQSTGMHVSEGQNPITKQWYIDRTRAIPWIDGRMVRLQVAIDITQLKQAESQIKASLKEKEVMLQEIHHRVKNNLQIISSLLNLQSTYVSDPQLVDIFQDSQGRIRSMAMIHEKLYRSKNLAQINFAEYIQDLSASMFSAQSSTLRGVALECNVLPILLNIDQAVPSGLILNELLSNALKHAFPSGGPGKVTVDLTTHSGQIHLTVSDNGIGFPPDFDFDQTDSLGLQLINTLVDQLDGSIEFNGQNGSRVEVSFPKHA